MKAYCKNDTKWYIKFSNYFEKNNVPFLIQNNSQNSQKIIKILFF